MAAKSDETKTAGKDESKTQQTTEQARVEQEKTPTKVEERGETDAKAAASGNTVGGVVDGDSAFVPEDAEDEWDENELDGAEGTVPEKSLDGEEYDVPFVHLTSETLPRTSDSDDPAVDWTAQHAGGERADEDGNELDPVALTEVVGTPGQTFRVSELPNREVVEAAGINYEQFVATLPVRLDAPDEAPRRGIPA